MFAIVDARPLAPDIVRFEIEAPRIARKWRAGQFVIVRIHEHGERIPLTIADSHSGTGTITLIVQGVGRTTKLLNSLHAGDALLDVVGPLGQPSDIKLFGTVVVIGGGVGTAIAWPTAVALHSAGNTVIGIIGGRTKDLVILEQELRAACEEVFVMTDDGRYGEKGLVTHKLRQLLDQGRHIDRVLAIGPIPMMQAVADLTRPLAIPTIVSLNPIMVDGTGMCGGCRVIAGGQSRFACVDGPEFDAHEVNFTNLIQRNRLYLPQEQAARQELQDHPEATVEIRQQCRLQEEHPEVGPQFAPAP